MEEIIKDVSNTGEEIPPKKKKKKLLIILIILVVAACGIGAYFFMNGDDWYDGNAQYGSYEGKSQEEIIAALNAQVKDGYMNLSIANTIVFEDGASEGEARIENIEANTRDQKVTITLDETGEVLYESGAIAPGEYIQTITLNRALEAGTYDATATFDGYDRETHEKKGTGGVNIRLHIKS